MRFYFGNMAKCWATFGKSLATWQGTIDGNLFWIFIIKDKMDTWDRQVSVAATLGDISGIWLNFGIGTGVVWATLGDSNGIWLNLSIGADVVWATLGGFKEGRLRRTFSR